MKGLKNNKTRWNDELAQVSWSQFEKLLAEYYAGRGYRVEHVGTGATASKFDGGIDLKLFKDGKYTVVQCKHWNVKQVPHNEVHQLIGIMVTEKADSGILVTSGEFTKAAHQAAAKHGVIELVDGNGLRSMLGSKISTLTIMPNSSSKRRGKVPVNSVSASFIVKVVLPVLIAIVMYIFIKSTLTSAAQDLQKNLSVKPKLHAESSILKPSKAEPEPELSKVKTIESPIAEIAPAEKVMTPDQLREWEKKNAESMKILEESTPDIAN